MPERMPETLDSLREKIGEEADYVDIKPYSHNIIGLVLRQIDRDYGKSEANKAIEDYGLEDLGWRKQS